MPRIVETSGVDLPFRVLFIGGGGTGKSNLFKRLQENGKWDSNIRPSIGVEFLQKIIKISDGPINLQFWDISSERQMRSITSPFYRKTSVVFVLYDITNRNSFLNIEDWLDGLVKSDNLGAQIVIVGNKCDLEDEREVSYEEAREFAEKKSYRFVEVSAKTLENVNYLMHLITTDLLTRYLKKKEEEEKILRLEEEKRNKDGVIKLKEKNEEKKKSFCAT